jgi:CRP-like cAMP-binding protein
MRPTAVADTIDWRRNELLARLSPSESSFLRSRLQLVKFERGDTIYRADDEIDSVYFPLSMVASRLTILEDGSTVEVGIIGRDGVVGLSAFMGTGRTRNWTVVDIGGEALRLRVNGLREVISRFSALSSVLSEYYQDFFTQVTRRAVCRSRHTIMEQLCSWLLMVRDRCETADLTLTQECIARRLGSRRAGITVAANALKKAGAIAYSRGHIAVTDRGKLEDLACECYGALHESRAVDDRWHRRPTPLLVGETHAA